MAYVFENQNLASTKATVQGADVSEQTIYTHNLTCVNGTESNADSIMAGVNQLYGIVGWSTDEVVRTVKQNVNNNE